MPASGRRDRRGRRRSSSDGPGDFHPNRLGGCAGIGNRSLANPIGHAGGGLRHGPRTDLARRAARFGRRPQLWRAGCSGSRQLLVARRCDPRHMGTCRCAAAQCLGTGRFNGYFRFSRSCRTIDRLGREARIHRQSQRARAGYCRRFTGRARAVRRCGDKPSDQFFDTACSQCVPHSLDGRRRATFRRWSIETRHAHRRRSRYEHGDESGDDRPGRLPGQPDRVAHNAGPIRRPNPSLGIRAANAVYRSRPATRPHQTQSENPRIGSGSYVAHR